MIRFVDEAINLASDPLISRESLSNYLSQNIDQADKRSRNTKKVLTATDGSSKKIEVSVVHF